MNSIVTIKIIFANPGPNGEEISEYYPSLLSCARHYKSNVPTIKNIAKGLAKETTRNKFFPVGTKFELSSIQKPIKNAWHCDICNVSVCGNSKCTHLMSAKHLNNMNNATLQ